MKNGAQLPGQQMVEQGLRDLTAGRQTEAALVVSMAVTALEQVGQEVRSAILEPELQLYRLLGQSLGDGAHSRYNALRRELSSYLRAASCANQSTPRG